MGTVAKGFDAMLASRPFLVVTFRHYGAEERIERQRVGKSKLKMVGLASLASNP